MTSFLRQPQEARLRDVLLVLVAAFGLSACIALIWLGMRAVMDIGGACAEVARSCLFSRAPPAHRLR